MWGEAWARGPWVEEVKPRHALEEVWAKSVWREELWERYVWKEGMWVRDVREGVLVHHE